MDEGVSVKPITPLRDRRNEMAFDRAGVSGLHPYQGNFGRGQITRSATAETGSGRTISSAAGDNGSGRITRSATGDTGSDSWGSPRNDGCLSSEFAVSIILRCKCPDKMHGTLRRYAFVGRRLFHH